jgi:phenylalanyl-tRNA synthetase beta chain
MLLSLNWLKEYVDLPRSITPEELGLRLTMHTVEIDSVEKQAERFENIVVGRIEKVSPHPNADKLRLAEVNVGKEVLRIVCGAPNIEPGQLVPVAKAGAVLPNGLEIKEAKIRGEKSVGMLCAEDELGLGEGHAGIMVLEKAKIGQGFADYLKMDDVLFEVDNKSITNRPDLWGHYGMARDISAFLDTKLKDYPAQIEKLKIENEKDDLKIKVEDHKLCPRYMAICMAGVEIKESPGWMQKRLIAVGMRPINNIVDITNYVMLESGQPLHAFDRSLLDAIVVRNAKKGEVIPTLDGEKRELITSDLVIADSKKPVAIAGVMGSENSEINQDTTGIVIESANFDPSSVRKTAQRLGLRTEASKRFEKSLDPNLCELALFRTVDLVRQSCPDAKVTSKILDKKNFDLDQGPIDLNYEWLKNFIGHDLETKKIKHIFEKLGFVAEEKEGKLQITVPTWRATKDITIKEDLAEEVSRIIGYDNLPPQMPRVEMAAPALSEDLKLIRKIKTLLAGGPALSETHNYSFVGEEQLKKLGISTKDYLRLANPISAHQTLLRQSLATNLIENVVVNQARYDEIGIFEIGSVYLGVAGELSKGNNGKLPYQEKRLGLVLAGGEQKELFLKAKGILEYLFGHFDLQPVFAQAEIFPAWADVSRSAHVNMGGSTFGTVSCLDKRIASKSGVKKETVVAEINLTKLLRAIVEKPEKTHQAFDKFPPVVRDIAFVVDEKIIYNDLKKEIEKSSNIIKTVELFDVYQGEKLGHGKKNLAFHIVYQADRTMTSEEIDQIQRNIVDNLEKKFEAKIRDF